VIVEFQAQQVFPIDSGAEGFGRLPIGERLTELEDCDQSEPPRSQGRLPPTWKEVGEVVVLEDRSEFVAQTKIRISLGKRGERDLSSPVGDGVDWCRLE
jgi:hypothetical protein